MASQSYRNLVVWQKAMGLVGDVYKIANKLPDIEKFALADQIRRSAVSIPSNIAEGQKRNGKLEFVHFCGIALGSLAELETQLILTEQLYGFEVEKELQICDEVTKMHTGLIKSLRTKNYELRTA